MTKPSENPAAQAAGRVAVVLAKPHTHAGKDYPAGASIEVTLKQKAFLEAADAVAKQAAKSEEN